MNTPSHFRDAGQLAQADNALFRHSAQRLSATAVAELIALLPEWQLHGDCLTRRYLLSDFASALAHANAIGQLAATINHHPDLTIGWGRLDVSWSSHDAGGLSIKDFIAAARCDQLENA